MITQIKLIAIAAAIVAAAYGMWRVVDLIGDARVITATETINQEGRNAADDVAKARQRVRDCAQSGGVWNRATGKCGPALQGPR